MKGIKWGRVAILIVLGMGIASTQTHSSQAEAQGAAIAGILILPLIGYWIWGLFDKDKKKSK